MTPQRIQTRLVDIAQGVSGELADAIANSPPLPLIPRQDSPFADRLCRAVVGQQLSSKNYAHRCPFCAVSVLFGHAASGRYTHRLMERLGIVVWRLLRLGCCVKTVAVKLCNKKRVAH